MNADATENLLLQAMGAERASALLPHFEPCDLGLGMPLETPGEPIEYAYFPERGVVSVIVLAREGGEQVEGGLIGREGLTGQTVVLGGDRSPHLTRVQIPGHARRIRADRLREVIERDHDLQSWLLRFAQLMSIQTAHAALAYARLRLEEKLARWLLMCHDRIESDELSLTHEFLSVMLGVRRAGVTVATHTLEGEGLIRARRGRIEIIDRRGLRRVAGAGYGTPETEYERLIGLPMSREDRS
ncbi:Crp/Fnr family transcriptional regulator [Wenxinia marina]|uniref:cAMP-binding protein n=1 Tax=Wenxinia marina DSM 24838 TaxID=1123501 RepID=A0A0D0Q9U2_9RHOB|nr:Crp/Fnr family transcriptional regulator [Wenxinia marina]KIQ71184.1 cAMP-binding protein [Wenxinia marina DSM 24838]GGL81856.1 cyclic nucleotide-binding protein [Wenxinia marina]